MKSLPSYLAVGRGDGAAEDVTATALMDEFGRRKATSVDFVVPDEAGDIEIPGAGFFSISAIYQRT